MDSAVLDRSFTDSGIREFSFRDCQVHTIPVFDIINVDISLCDVAISSDCGEISTGLRDSVGSPFRGDTPFDPPQHDFGVSLCEEHAPVNATLDPVSFPATARDFVPHSPFSGEQFFGISNLQFAVSLHDNNASHDSVSVTDYDDHQNTRVATNRDFVQFSGTSNRDFAVSIHDNNPPLDSVSVPVCDNHQNTLVDTTRDFVPRSVIPGDQFYEISNGDFAVSFHDNHTTRDSVKVTDYVNHQNTMCDTVVFASPEDLQLPVLEDNAFDISTRDCVFSTDSSPSDSLTLASPDPLNYFVFLHEAVAFTGLPNYKCRRIPIFTHLRLDTWDDLLVDYHDNIICEYLRYGWPVNYDYATCGFPRTDDRTHRGALNYPAAVSTYLREEISVGVMAGPFSEIPFSTGQMALSPLNSVPKDDGNERRIILDLSWPSGSSVNAGISGDEYDGQLFHLCYPTVNHIAELVVKHSVGCHIFKRDLCRAYCQFPVDPFDYPLLGYRWEDLLYFDTVLPMGLRSSAMACQRITSAVCFLCSQSGFDVLNYLDDFMGVAPKDLARDSYDFLGGLLSRLGLTESSAKAIPPGTVVSCLGVQFDTVNMTMSVPPSRLAEITSLLASWRIRKSCSKTALQSLVGKLMFVAKCVPQSRIFVSRILDVLRSIQSPIHHVRLTAEFRKDIRLWQLFLPLYNGVSVIPTSPWSAPDEVFATEACLSGCGGLSSTEYFHSPFPSFVSSICSAIHHLELLTVMVAVRLWGQH